jgi:hypothetical protein
MPAKYSVIFISRPLSCCRSLAQARKDHQEKRMVRSRRMQPGRLSEHTDLPFNRSPSSLRLSQVAEKHSSTVRQAHGPEQSRRAALPSQRLASLILALLNSRLARRRSRFNRASRCDVGMKQGARHRAQGARERISVWFMFPWAVSLESYAFITSHSSARRRRIKIVGRLASERF